MSQAYRIERPDPARAAELSALAVRSKSWWGYSEEFLAACAEELRVTPEDCASGDLYAAFDRVAGAVDSAVGFVAVRGHGVRVELGMLFVDPPWIGSGAGGLLLDAARELARSRGARVLVLDADPGAEAFYLHRGARRVGESPSGSIPGRMLPRLEFPLG